MSNTDAETVRFFWCSGGICGFRQGECRCCTQESCGNASVCGCGGGRLACIASARNGFDEVRAGFFDASGREPLSPFCGGLFRTAFFPEGFCFRVASLSLNVSFKLKSSPPKSTQVRLRRTRCTACGTCTTGIAFNGGSEFRLLASVGAGDIFSPECRNCPFAQDTLYCLHRLYDGGCV